MYKILLASDGSTNSFKAAEEVFKLAGPLQAEVTVIAVVPELSSTPLPTDVLQTMKNNAKIVIEKNKDFFDEKGLKINTVVEQGNPGTVICGIAEEDDYDLIVIGSSGLGNIGELFLGSVSNKIVHCAKKPVMIVR